MCLNLLLYQSVDKCVNAGPAVPLHVPVLGVHRHRHHLQHHPPRRHCPAADAHSEILLLGHQPAGVQWNQPQRSWYVQKHTNIENTLCLYCSVCIARPNLGLEKDRPHLLH